MTSDELWQAVIDAPDAASREARSVEYIDAVLAADRELVAA